MVLQFDFTKLFSSEFHILNASIVSSDIFFEGGLVRNNLKSFLAQLSGIEEEEEEEEDGLDEIGSLAAAAVGTAVVAEACDDDDEDDKNKTKAGEPAQESAFSLVCKKFEFKDSGITFKLTGVPDIVAEKTAGYRLAAPDYVTSIGGSQAKAATKELSQNYIDHILAAVVGYIEGLTGSLPDVIGEQIIDTIAENVPGPLGDMLQGAVDGEGLGDLVESAVDGEGAAGIIGGIVDAVDGEGEEGAAGLLSDIVDSAVDGEGEGAAGLLGDIVDAVDGDDGEKGGESGGLMDFVDAAVDAVDGEEGEGEGGAAGLLGEFVDAVDGDDDQKEEGGAAGLLGEFVNAVDDGKKSDEDRNSGGGFFGDVVDSAADVDIDVSKISSFF
eukprot:CAMPEP_0201507596 /NCGR_PEP_ID=MMETSP0161_2-20130828/1231_1 /ASSEMBLY_ACC=CAM_ASM_000251 /TAXON_ID=180227 /ORGANISM="Neoparamoeba aestuarina, Strain SoJaBio B1-5/56/2" /LENGTH=382 /DNA_ID=CAMNT_0047902015 /DNA_START=282 /DNA_END=1430 /DNA_ORIENTATION=-